MLFPPLPPPPFSFSPQRHFLLNLESTKENWSRKLHLRAPPPASCRGPPALLSPWCGWILRAGGRGGRAQEPGPQSRGGGHAPLNLSRGWRGVGGSPARPPCGESCRVAPGGGGSGTLAAGLGSAKFGAACPGSPQGAAGSAR